MLTIVAATDDNVLRSRLQMPQFVTAGVRGVITASMERLVHDEPRRTFLRRRPGRVLRPAGHHRGFGPVRRSSRRLSSACTSPATTIDVSRSWPQRSNIPTWRPRGLQQAVGGGLLEDIDVLDHAPIDTYHSRCGLDRLDVRTLLHQMFEQHRQRAKANAAAWALPAPAHGLASVSSRPPLNRFGHAIGLAPDVQREKVRCVIPLGATSDVTL